MVYGIHRESIYGLKWALLWFDMTVIQNCPTSGCLPYQIQTKSVKWFMGYMESPITVFYKLGFIRIHDSKLELSNNFL
jgi:hypothetical protein